MSEYAPKIVVGLVGGNRRCFEREIVLHDDAIFAIAIDIGRIFRKDVDDPLESPRSVESRPRAQDDFDALDELDWVRFVEPNPRIADIVHWHTVL